MKQISKYLRGARRKRPCGSHERHPCKCIGDFYELRELGNGLVGTQEGVECSVLVALPQEVSESLVLFTFNKYVVTGLAWISTRTLHGSVGTKREQYAPMWACPVRAWKEHENVEDLKEGRD